MGPAYVFDAEADGTVRYEDAVTLDESWDELADLSYCPPGLDEADVSWARREESRRRILGLADGAAHEPAPPR